MTSTELVLVTGATGAVGPSVVQELLAAGYRVRTLALAPAAAPLPPEVESVWGDVTDPGAVEAAVAGASAVAHLAARLHLAGPPSRDIEAYRHVNVHGTATVVKAARQAGVRQIVYASTISVYGPSGSAVVSESMPPKPDTPYGVTKLMAEDLVREAVGLDGRPIGTVLRLAAVYGAGVKGNYRALVEALAAGRFVPVGHGRNRRTLIHGQDVARAVAHAFGAPAAAGRTFNVTDGRVHTTDEIVAAICRALGRRPPRLRIPAAPAFVAAAIVDALAGLVGRDTNPLFERLKRYTEDVAVDGSLFATDTGFVPRFPLGEGWRQVVQALAASGELRAPVRTP